MTCKKHIRHKAFIIACPSYDLYYLSAFLLAIESTFTLTNNGSIGEARSKGSCFCRSKSNILSALSWPQSHVRGRLRSSKA